MVQQRPSVKKLGTEIVGTFIQCKLGNCTWNVYVMIANIKNM